jgi:FkbM family methyltransferase
MSFSQGGEEAIILSYFGDRIGRFLEIGAWDGQQFSNCYELSRRGWGGVCVEPDPPALEGLRRTHAGNPRIAIIGSALGDVDGSIRFHSSWGGGVSTTSDAHRDKWSTAAKFVEIEVPAISVATFVTIWPGPYPFVSLDVEGENLSLLRKLPLSQMSVEMICVEHDGATEEVEAYCLSHGLARQLYRSGENLIVAK